MRMNRDKLSKLIQIVLKEEEEELLKDINREVNIN